jgi:hypothetical protein
MDLSTTPASTNGLLNPAALQPTEYRLTPPTPNHTPITIRRGPARNGTRWAVIHVPGDRPKRHVWTKDGWDAAWCLSREEMYCWPSSAEAIEQARRAMADVDYEADEPSAPIGI